MTDKNGELQIVKNLDAWQAFESAGKTGGTYARAAVQFARQWGVAMQQRLDNNECLSDIAWEVANQVDDHIPANVIRAAGSALSKSWKHGEELNACFEQSLA